MEKPTPFPVDNPSARGNSSMPPPPTYELQNTQPIQHNMTGSSSYAPNVHSPGVQTPTGYPADNKSPPPDASRGVPFGGPAPAHSPGFSPGPTPGVPPPVHQTDSLHSQPGYAAQPGYQGQPGYGPQPGQPGQPAYGAQPGQHGQPGQPQPAYGAQHGQPSQPGQANYGIQPGQPATPMGANQPQSLPINMLQSQSAPVVCPGCGSREMTETRQETGNFTHAIAAAVCCVACLGCIPYCISSLKDVHHRCGKCGIPLAVFHRSGRTEVLAYSSK